GLMHRDGAVAAARGIVRRAETDARRRGDRRRHHRLEAQRESRAARPRRREKARPAMKISILGAGSCGTALAIHLARLGHQVRLWARCRGAVWAILSWRPHPGRRAEPRMPAAVRATSDLSEAFAHSETVVRAIPCASLRSVLDAGPGPGEGSRRFLSTAKGI